MANSSAVPQSYFGFDRVSSTCSTGLKTYIITGVILQILRVHFSTKTNIVDRQLNDYVWTDDYKTTGILIEEVTKWDRRNTQERPSLLVKRNATGFAKIGLNDGGHGDTYTKMCSGSHTVFAIGQSGMEAERLASEAANGILFVSPIIRSEMKFMDFTVAQIGGVSKLQESNEHWVVPITVAWSHAVTWSVVSAGPLLKVIDMDVQQT